MTPNAIPYFLCLSEIICDFDNAVIIGCCCTTRNRGAGCQCDNYVALVLKN